MQSLYFNAFNNLLSDVLKKKKGEIEEIKEKFN